MRKEATMLLALALAASGCKALGFTDESTKDWSASSTRSGEVLKLVAPEKVVVQKFTTDFAGPKPKVMLSLKNEGEFYDIFSVDVEFGYPAPPDSFAPYDPQFVAVDLTEFKPGDVVDREVLPPAGAVGKPLFARVLVTTGADVRMTTGRENSKRGLRKGSSLLAGKVEVVEVKGALDSEKPSIAFVVENVSDEAVGALRYKVQFFKDGKAVELGRRLRSLRPVAEPLGAKGSRVTIEVSGLEGVEGLAGSKPVLRLIQ